MVTKRRGCIIFSIIGFLYFFFAISERELALRGNILWNTGWTLKLLLLSLLSGGIAGSGLFLLVDWIKKKGRRRRSIPFLTRAVSRFPDRPVRVFWLSFFLTALCWFCAWLAYYPGICSYDFSIQLGQITGAGYNDHHPIAHTLLIAFFLKAGELLGDPNRGIALFSLLQFLLLAAAFAGGISFLAGRRVKKGVLLLLLCYSMFFPFHWYLSVSITKDVLFSAGFFLMLLCLCRLLFSEKESSLRPGWWDAGFVVTGLLAVLFRGNGRYAILVLAAFLLLTVLFSKKSRRLFLRLFAETVLVLGAGSLLLSLLFAVTDANQGDRREMLSLPIQQLARTMLYHGGVGELPLDDGTMEEEDRALIRDFLLDEAYRDYRPDIADPVKSHTNTYVARYRAGDFINTYLGLLVQYPGDYINAALAVNAGYLWPQDVSHATINVNGRDRGLGYVQTRWMENELNPQGIYKDSKWGWLHERLEEFADGNGYLKLPVLKYLFVPGSYLWLYLVLAGWLLYDRRYRQLLPLTLALGYYVTLLLGPTVQLRYLYPLMVSLPFLAAFFLGGCLKAKESQQAE